MEIDDPLRSAEEALETAVDKLEDSGVTERRRAAHAIRDAFAMIQRATRDIIHNGYELADAFHRTRAAINRCRRERELKVWLDTGFELCNTLREAALLETDTDTEEVASCLVKD